MLHTVILAGGSGTRLWPLSRAHYPKQFLQLLGDHTLLQQTVLRLNEVIPAERVWIVTGKEQEFIVRSQLAGLPGFEGNKTHILVEPLPRNTAAAIGLAAIHIQKQDPQGVMVVLPADHWIERQSAFVTLIQRATDLVNQGLLVTLGIIPDRAETGYGYIRRGDPVRSVASSSTDATNAIDAIDATDAYHVQQFVEKPDLATAQHYVASKEYYWNAGIFLWQVSAILEKVATYLPGLHQGLGEISHQLHSDQARRTLETEYARLDAVSIDYGVLEKSSGLVVLPADLGWSDLGDWNAIHRLSRRDERGNVLSPNVLDAGSENSFIYSQGRLIATIGLKNTVVIDADDALLICPNDRVQEVKAVAHQLQIRGAEEAYDFRTVHRPWGTYTVLEEGAGFKVKRIVVNPGAALSLQLHHHRSEHWVVVLGVALVTRGDQKFTLQVGQSTYVPKETIHRLENPGTESLEIIEVQTGSYLGEDDIVRLDDLYQRVSSRA
jgi:mannose-1-phosphate guanylyltransferase/mannose-6-phosphate isomerase